MPLIADRRRFILGAGLAGLATLAAPRFAFAAQTSGFTHGVASGDPRQTQVTLWTRYVAASETLLHVEVADDEAFTRIAQSGEAAAHGGTDWCVHARIAGLMPGRWYWYRFTSPSGERSAVGRTRTLPDGKPVHFRIAVFSCSNGPVGWFNAYAHAAAREDVDLAIHLGDYLYEAPVMRPGQAPGLAQRRGLAPDGELLQLTDYRARYGSYRSDPDLAELHRRLPMITVWDDHETSNDSWQGGAEGHQSATDGDWALRKSYGVRAWREWLPMSDNWYDSYQIGDLATLFRLETRLLGRSRQLATDLQAIVAAGGADLQQNLVAFGKGPLADTKRSMMGPGQERWLADGLAESTAQGTRWQVLANQVIIGTTKFPKSSAAWFTGGVTPPDVAADLMGREAVSMANLPYSMDKWDGYPAARDRLFASARAAKANIVTLTGDSHNAWAFNLADKAGPIGVEFAGQSVSSNGMERRFNGDVARVAADYVKANPGLRWMDASQRGYFVLDIGRDRVETEYVFMPSGAERNPVAAGTKKIVAERGARKLSV
jgi:alkaline phosphatase D